MELLKPARRRHGALLFAVIVALVAAWAMLGVRPAHAVGEPCGKYKPGSGGVIQTFCHGTAKVQVKVDGAAKMLSGGECSVTAQGFALNLGVVTDHSVAPPPDYVGLLAPVKKGAFKDAVLSVKVNGKRYTVMRNSGTIGPKGGTFGGVGTGGVAIEGAFTC